MDLCIKEGLERKAEVKGYKNIDTRLVNWWNKLENLKNRKLIASHNVQFFENEIPSKLVIMNINKLDIPHWVNKLVDNTHTKLTYKDNLILPVSISADIIKKSTFKNKYHTMLAF